MIFEGLMDPSFRIPSVSEPEIEAGMLVMIVMIVMVWQCWGFGSDSRISHVTAWPRCVASTAGNFRPGKGRGLSVPKEDWSTGQLFETRELWEKLVGRWLEQDILAIWWDGDIFLYSWLTSEELERGGSGRVWRLKCDLRVFWGRKSFDWSCNALVQVFRLRRGCTAERLWPVCSDFWAVKEMFEFST